MAADHPEIARQAHGVAEAHAEAHEGAHDEVHHPDWRTYRWVALFLTVITIIEVWIYYTPFREHRLFVPALLTMSAAKFTIVVLFYMHLKYDAKLFRALFTGPLTIAIVTLISLLFLFGHLLIRA
jgi:cytochrome c oxidase subunit IV